MKHFRFGFAALLLLAACSGVDASDESVANVGAALDTPPVVLGFENTTSWSVSQGTKSSSTTHTQGSFSLGVANFTYSELTSQVLSNLTGVTSTIAFDFRAPSVPAWGTAQLFVNIPSRSIFNANLGSVSLAGSPANTFRSLSFTVPTNVLTALGQSYADLTFKIALNAPQLSQAYLVDNLHFVGTTTANQVTLNVSGVDDFLYVTVDGVRRKVVPYQQSIAGLDVSSWFAGGANSVRIQAINTGGPASYTVQLLVDGQAVIDTSCADAPCDTSTATGAGILFDQTYTVTTPNRPAASTLTVNGTSGAKIYLNDAYTGKSVPSSFTLPQGSYTVGVGVGEGVPGAYTGQYFEQAVQLAASAQTVTPTQGAALALPNHTKIGFLPIRTTIHGAGGPDDTGVLSDSDISSMFGQALATRDAYVKPFSYGLTTWDIDLLPTVENTPLYRDADPESAPDTARFLEDAGLTSLEQTYDSIIYFFSKYTANGDVVADDPCCFWGGGQGVSFPNHTTRNGESANDPNVFLLHEMLHDYESYNSGRLGFYNGAGGLHGANFHGYHGNDNGEDDFLQFYRRFMRNQVAEVDSMRDTVDWTAAPPTSADLWIGVFDTMRRDVNWQTTAPLALAAAASAPHSTALAKPIASPAPSCKLSTRR